MFCRVQQLQELEQRLAQLASKLDQQLLMAKSSGLVRKLGDDGGLASARVEGGAAGGERTAHGVAAGSSRESSGTWEGETAAGKQSREKAGVDDTDVQPRSHKQARSEVPEAQQEQQQSPQDAGVLLQVLQAMERLEKEEQEVRSRWFVDHLGTASEVRCLQRKMRLLDPSFWLLK
jgi:hypothetical protein